MKIILVVIGIGIVGGITAGIIVSEVIEYPQNGSYSIRSLEAYSSPPLGHDGALLTMIEWGDYQCTYCYRFHQNTLDTIKEKYVDSGLVRIVFRDYPLNGFDSVLAAHASRCAAEQDAYWAYHDTLYQNWGGERTGWIDRTVLYGFALEVNLNISRFTDCMDSGRYMNSIESGYQHSRSIAIDATPSFIVHDGKQAVKITGNQPYSAFEAVFDSMLE